MPDIVYTTDPRAVLVDLLNTINSPTSRHYARYQPLLSAYPGDLTALLYDLLRKDILRLFHTRNVTGRSLQSQTFTYPSIPGIYIHSIYGRDKQYRFYVGQSTSLATRIKKQHMYFRWRRDHPSLHYHVLQQSDFDTYVILAEVPRNVVEPVHLHLVLNLLEMWCCLLFQTLPPGTLAEWLANGETSITRRAWGLNVALPLDQGDVTPQQAVDGMSETPDPVVRGYYEKEVPSKPVVVNLAVSRHPWNLSTALLGGTVCGLLWFVLRQNRQLRALSAGRQGMHGFQSTLAFFNRLWGF